jgi:hypothetical protein
MLYNGHKNWNHWNVSLWINNDEGLYQSALSWVRAARNKDKAARAFLYALVSADYGNPTPKTPDGARYSISSIRSAMRGMN